MSGSGYLTILTFTCVLIALCRPAYPSGIPAENLKTFGSSGKELRVLSGGREAELLAHQGRGCLTHMWFGGDWPGYDRTRIRCYVDGETRPSIDMELFMGHGIGFGDEAAPWGTERIGKTGHPSGIYNTYRIPFGSSIRVTAQLGENVDANPDFWWIVRGVDNLPVQIGGIELPETARLRLYELEECTVGPLDYVDLCQTGNAGMLYQVTLSVKSGNLNFLEAILRAYLDGASEPLPLSSGTEDYFLGTYYFNRGQYHFPEAGLTHLDTKDNTFSAYRFHEQDPIVFQKGLRLTWRNGEARLSGHVFGDPKSSQVRSYVWLYEWPSTEN
ncbi:MAG: hypothetical protein QG656_1065 [Candidatus Hydrogenedentes bacterium]|nr:hypothetical protein [Candidatus Hydrogenedentota bacterium]